MTPFSAIPQMRARLAGWLACGELFVARLDDELVGTLALGAQSPGYAAASAPGCADPTYSWRRSSRRVAMPGGGSAWPSCSGWRGMPGGAVPSRCVWTAGRTTRPSVRTIDGPDSSLVARSGSANGGGNSSSNACRPQAGKVRLASAQGRAERSGSGAIHHIPRLYANLDDAGSRLCGTAKGGIGRACALCPSAPTSAPKSWS